MSIDTEYQALRASALANGDARSLALILDFSQQYIEYLDELLDNIDEITAEQYAAVESITKEGE